MTEREQDQKTIARNEKELGYRGNTVRISIEIESGEHAADLSWGELRRLLDGVMENGVNSSRVEWATRHPPRSPSR